jgi:peptide deformylase
MSADVAMADAVSSPSPLQRISVTGAAAAAADLPLSSPPPPRPATEQAAAAASPPKPAIARNRVADYQKWAAIAIAVVVLALVLPRAGGYLADWWVAGRGVPPVVYALAHVVPTEECLRVTPDEIRNGTTAAGGVVSLRNVRASLYHHLRYGTGDTGPLQGISAQYLERHRICLALVNMVFSPTDKENLVEMYNLRVTGGSTSRVVQNTERSVLCKEPYTVKRFQVIIVEYYTAEGVRMEREVKGVAAQIIQQLDDVQSGRGYCKDTNVEALVQKLYEKIGAGAQESRRPAYPALGDGRRT